jgi:8-oxo-dGTP pyrophosphatase MutT (NUDIX family)
MLHLIPASLHRAGLRAAHRARKSWWRLARPKLTGVTVIAFNGEGQVLMVRHTYGSGKWTLPGGGIRAGEDPAAAALREFAEELGCPIEGVEAIGLLGGTLYGAPIGRYIFAGSVSGTPRPDGREVAEAGFFARDGLPDGCSAFVGECLGMLKQR